ncbi:MAG: tetratricopeptide repeat protein [Candidatus Eisenbacteria bacterium]|nr:tetratricopeptide repeat protein [Candidatus Eisenbacteria bacterium]
MRGRLLLAAALLALALPLAVTSGGVALARDPLESTDPIDRGMAEAKGLIRLGRMDEALTKLRALREANPTNTRVTLYLGKQLAESGKPDEAIQLYRESRERVEDVGPILVDQARIHREQKQWTEAVETCLEYQTRLGDRGSWVENELESLIRSDRLGEEALGSIERAAAAHPEDRGLARLFVLALFYNGQGEKALERAAALDRRLGGRGDALVPYAALALEKAAFDQALGAYDAALKLNLEGERREEVLYRRAQVLRKERRLDECLLAYDALLAANGSGRFARPARLEKAQILAKELNRKEEALAAYKELLGTVQSGRRKEDIALADQTRLAMADCALLLQRPAEAEAIYAQLADSARSPEVRVEALFQKGEMLFYQGKLKEAETVYYQLTDLYPTDVWVNDALGRILLIGENVAGGNGLTAIAQAAYQRRLLQYTKALGLIDEAIAATPTANVSDDLWLDRTRTLLELGRAPEAAASADTLAAQFPESPLAPRALFEVAEQWSALPGGETQATALLERVLIKYPNSLEAPGARAALAAIKAKGKESSFDAQSTPRHGGG